MRLYMFGSILAIFILPIQNFARSDRACIPPSEASQALGKDVCIAAHIYDVVQLPDRTTFLDTCAPETPDEQCRFTLVSYWEDHNEVGELRRYRDIDVHVRGIVRPMHGRAGILVSHARQFYGGPPKFRPNPRLMRGFNGEQVKPPLNDPNLRTQGGGRTFMNSKDKESLPVK